MLCVYLQRANLAKVVAGHKLARERLGRNTIRNNELLFNRRELGNIVIFMPELAGIRGNGSGLGEYKSRLKHKMKRQLVWCSG